MPEAAHEGDWEAIARLCAHFGIALDYHDIWGAHRPVPRETLLALLAEFGVQLHDGAPADALLEAARRASWSRGLPPVQVVRASSADWTLPLRMPASMSRLRWQLCEENGAQQQGELDTAALPQTAGIEIDGERWCERQLPFASSLPMGYHRLRIEGLEGETLLVSAPERCWRPAALRDGGRVWGPALQLYCLLYTSPSPRD